MMTEKFCRPPAYYGINELHFLGVTEEREVRVGAGEGPVEGSGPVLHPFEPGFDQGGQLARFRLARDRLRWDQTSSPG